MPTEIESELKRLDRDFNEMKLFHRDVVNEMKRHGLVLTELKEYIKQLAEFKHDISGEIGILHQSLRDHVEREHETTKRIFEMMESKEHVLEKRIESLESDRKWIIRIVVGTIIAALLALVVTGGSHK